MGESTLNLRYSCNLPGADHMRSSGKCSLNEQIPKVKWNTANLCHPKTTVKIYYSTYSALGTQQFTFKLVTPYTYNSLRAEHTVISVSFTTPRAAQMLAAGAPAVGQPGWLYICSCSLPPLRSASPRGSWAHHVPWWNVCLPVIPLFTHPFIH